MADLGVVIPAYNAEGTIGSAIESAKQVGAVEVVVVDDGSTDATAAQAERLGAKVIRQENAGAARARAVGLDATTAKYVVFLDADDQLVATGVRESLHLLESHERAVAAIAATRVISAHGRSMTMRQWPEGVSTESLVARAHSPAPPGAFVWDAARLASTAGHRPAPLEPRFAEDYEMVLRAAPVGAILQHGALGYEYRVDGGKSSRSPRSSQEAAEALRTYYGEAAGIRVRPRKQRQLRSAALRRQAMEQRVTGRGLHSFASTAAAVALDPMWAWRGVRTRLTLHHPSRGEPITVLGWPWRVGVRNTYTARFADALEVEGVNTVDFRPKRPPWPRHDIIHLHWPERIASDGQGLVRVAKVCHFRLQLAWSAVVRRRPVVWTVHNLVPHDPAPVRLLNAVHRTLERRVTGAVFLTEAGRSEAVRAFPWLDELPWALALHGLYEGEFRPSAEPGELRARFGWSERDLVLVAAGTVAPYKGVMSLARTVAATNDDRLRLCIAGACSDPALRTELLELAQADPRIEVRFGWLSSADYADLVTAATVVVQPYHEVFNSGSIMVPLQLGTPVLVPRSPAFEELAAIAGDGIILYSPPLSPTLLMDALREVRGQPDVRLQNFDWARGARNTRSLYEELLSRRA